MSKCLQEGASVKAIFSNRIASEHDMATGAALKGKQVNLVVWDFRIGLRSRKA